MGTCWATYLSVPRAEELRLFLLRHSLHFAISKADRDLCSRRDLATTCDDTSADRDQAKASTQDLIGMRQANRLLLTQETSLHTLSQARHMQWQGRESLTKRLTMLAQSIGRYCRQAAECQLKTMLRPLEIMTS